MRIKEAFNKKNKSITYSFMVLFLLVFSIYLRFLAPSVLPGDHAEFALVSKSLGIPHPNGYPIYTWVGYIFAYLPIGDVAYRINLMSAFFGALTVSLLYLLIFNILGKKISQNKKIISSILTSLLLAVTLFFWIQCEAAEVYTFNTFFITFMLLLLVLWSKSKNLKLLYVFSFIYGLSLGAHASNILFLPAFLVFIILTDKSIIKNKKAIFFIFILFLLGASQFFYIYFRALSKPEFNWGNIDSITAWKNHITDRPFKDNMFVYSLTEIPGRLRIYYEYLKINFNFLGIILGLIGIMQLARKNLKWFLLLILMFLGNIFFFIQSNLWDVHIMFIPSFLIFAIFIGYSIKEIILFLNESSIMDKLSIPENHRKILIGMFLIFFFFFIFQFYLKNYAYVDNSKKTIYAEVFPEVLKELPENSTIVTGWDYHTIFRYYQIVDKINPNVEVPSWSQSIWIEEVEKRINKKELFVLEPQKVNWDGYELKEFKKIQGITVYKIEKSSS